MKHVLIEVSDDYEIVSVQDAPEYDMLLKYIDKYSKDDGGIYMCDDHVEHLRRLFERGGILSWTDTNDSRKYCLIDMDYPFEKEDDYEDSYEYESTGRKLFRKLKYLIRDIKINDIFDENNNS